MTSGREPLFPNSALNAFLAGLQASWNADEQATEPLRASVRQILERTRHESGTARNDKLRAQLVVGEVQSGKTGAIQGVTAAARDAGIPLIVVLAGTKVTLTNQTLSRFKSDLGPSDATSDIQWHVSKPPKPPSRSASQAQHIEYQESVRELGIRIHDFLSTDLHEAQRVCTVFIITKSKASITSLARQIELVVDNVGQFPVLMIDDEADQATQNIASNRAKRSAVYASIVDFLDLFSSADYVMFTATPYATLYQDALTDTIAPEFATVLTPGPGYFGLAEMCESHDKQSGSAKDFIRILDDDEYPDALANGAIPGGLTEAFTYFLLTFAATRPTTLKPVSMLVHPSGSQVEQRQVAAWLAENLRPQFLSLNFDVTWYERFAVRVINDQPVLKARLQNEAQKMQRDIQEYVQHQLQLIEAHLEFAVVNSDSNLNQELSRRPIEGLTKPKPTTDWPAYWNKKMAWVLIGGNAIERGFTLKNLVVTYMPRKSSNQADVNQQRGRFFGYRPGYLELCRAWMPQRTVDLFREVNTLDQYVRELLNEASETRQSLDDLERILLISPRLKPTRSNIQGLTENRFRLRPWLMTQSRLEAVSHETAMDALQELRSALRPYPLKKVEDDDRRGVPENDRHHSTLVPLPTAREILSFWPSLDPQESDLIAALSAYLEQAESRSPQTTVTVILMDNLKMRVSEEAGIRRRSPRTGSDTSARERTYNIHGAGQARTADRKQLAERGLTLQFHAIYCNDGGVRTDNRERIRSAMAIGWGTREQQRDLLHLVQDE